MVPPLSPFRSCRLLRGIASQTLFLFVELYEFCHVRILHVVTSVYTRQEIALSILRFSASPGCVRCVCAGAYEGQMTAARCPLLLAEGAARAGKWNLEFLRDTPGIQSEA